MKNLEIERKFLVDKDKWSITSKPDGTSYIQGYLSIDDEKTVRVRVAGNSGFLTIKGKSETICHPEYEYAIPADDALELIRRYALSAVEKVRTRISFKNHVWEVDEFHGNNEGLLMAEIELESPEEVFEKPEWLREEVTGDPRYYNSRLSLNPFTQWK
ncbi:MAG: CYTH domain-containing protein [Bacteroidetes bacterium]|nr:CYTH domain-containing protein [Bacteroidota bacterium]